MADEVHVNQKECHLDVSDKNSTSIPLLKSFHSKNAFVNLMILSFSLFTLSYGYTSNFF
jgi:hypothetical protein